MKSCDGAKDATGDGPYSATGMHINYVKTKTCRTLRTMLQQPVDFGGQLLRP